MKQSQLKIVILGRSSVGKSSILLRYVTNDFNSKEDPTIGAAYMGKTISRNGSSIKLNIWDTAGQERYHTLAKMYYHDADAAILVYDITSNRSFQELKRWHSDLIEVGPPHIIKVIVGNKDDLVAQEEVSPDEASKFAAQIGALYRRISAKTNNGIEQTFLAIIDEYLRTVSRETKEKSALTLKPRAPEEPSRSRCC